MPRLCVAVSSCHVDKPRHLGVVVAGTLRRNPFQACLFVRERFAFPALRTTCRKDQNKYRAFDGLRTKRPMFELISDPFLVEFLIGFLIGPSPSPRLACASPAAPCAGSQRALCRPAPFPSRRNLPLMDAGECVGTMIFRSAYAPLGSISHRGCTGAAIGEKSSYRDQPSVRGFLKRRSTYRFSVGTYPT